MSGNANLNRAGREKNDEYYTRREDIENELAHYTHHFQGKTVYCNCDDPEWSEFWKFFQRNFTTLGLKRLIATHYEPNDKNFSYSIEMQEGDDWHAVPKRKPLPCNGSFRSAACIELLEKSDIVVTNPPFSIAREFYIPQLMEYKKKFLIIGDLNWVTYKSIFPLVKDNEMWFGYNSVKAFREPDGSIKKFGNKLWFTNLDIPKRHKPLDLRGNYYTPERYPKYENYNAIEVKPVADIPCDYDGIMGVPITFLNLYNPEQFEILMMANGNTRTNTTADILERVSYRPHPHDKGGLGIINGELVYARVLIKNKNPESRRYSGEASHD